MSKLIQVALKKIDVLCVSDEKMPKIFAKFKKKSLILNLSQMKSLKNKTEYKIEFSKKKFNLL